MDTTNRLFKRLPPHCLQKTSKFLSEIDPRATIELINMHKAPKALATRWSGHPSTCHLGTFRWPLRGLALRVLLTMVTTSYQTTCTALQDYFNKDIHASIDVDKLFVLFYTVRQFPPNYSLHCSFQPKTFLFKHKTVQCNVAISQYNWMLCLCKRFETVLLVFAGIPSTLW